MIILVNFLHIIYPPKKLLDLNYQQQVKLQKKTNIKIQKLCINEHNRRFLNIYAILILI